MSTENRGFTLIELIIVMAVMGVVLSFTLPRFEVFNLFGASMTPTGKLLLLVEQLKSRAMETGRDCLLHLDPATGQVWVTASEMDEGGSGKAVEEGDGLKKDFMADSIIDFSDEYVLEDVKIPEGIQNQKTDSEAIAIWFSGDGYCDQAFIYIREDDVDFTVHLEPFLPRAQLMEGHVFCGE